MNKIKAIDMKVRLSTLWIFVLFNYVYADLLTIFDALFGPGAANPGAAPPIQISQGFLMFAAVLMEVSIVMIVLSRILKYRANRLANIIAGTIKTLAVIGSMFVGTPAPYYIFFGTIEIACTSFIVWYAWQWRDPAEEAT